jgi:hypothetical protein
MAAMTDHVGTMLNDTLYLFSMARETARLQGSTAQVDRLTPVVEGLREIVSSTKTSQSEVSNSSMNQDGIRELLTFLQGSNAEAGRHEPENRSVMISAMLAGGMPEIEVARQLGVSHEEVRIIKGQKSDPNFPVGKKI